MTKTPLRAILTRATTDAISNQPFRPAPTHSDTTRRALFGFVGLAGVAVAMPAVVVASMQAAPTGVYADYVRALTEFNNVPDDLETVDKLRWQGYEDRYRSAHDALSAATPTTLAEFAIYYDAVSDGEAWSERCLAIIRDLAAQEGR